MTPTLIFIKCLYRIYFTNLNWVFGKRFLRTSFEFFMHVGEIKSRLSTLGVYLPFADGFQTNDIPRYRQISSFGRDTIRRFNGNVSAMKKLAARDWEDLLQVRYIPYSFFGLLAHAKTSL